MLRTLPSRNSAHRTMLSVVAGSTWPRMGRTRLSLRRMLPLVSSTRPRLTGVSSRLKKAAGLEVGSPEPNKKKVGRVTRKQVEEIARLKMPDLNTTSLEAAVRMIEGTARSMGIEVVG